MPPVVAGGAAVMLNARVAVPVAPQLVTLRLTADDPAAVGGPAILTFPALFDCPAGKPAAP